MLEILRLATRVECKSNEIATHVTRSVEPSLTRSTHGEPEKLFDLRRLASFYQVHRRTWKIFIAESSMDGLQVFGRHRRFAYEGE